VPHPFLQHISNLLLSLIYSFNAVYSELLKASLNKLQEARTKPEKNVRFRCLETNWSAE